MPRNKLTDFEKEARLKIAHNLHHYMRGMTQQDLADKADIPLTTLSGYLLAKSTPAAGQLEKIADALHVRKSDIDPRYGMSLDEVIKERNETRQAIREEAHLIPFLKTENVHLPLDDKDNVIKKIPIFSTSRIPSDELFAFRYSGDFLLPSIGGGTTAIIHRDVPMSNGDIACVLIGHRLSLKRIEYLSSKEILLKPGDSAHETYVVGPENHTILGKLVRLSTQF